MDLPFEIINYILDFTGNDKAMCARVCTTFYSLMKKEDRIYRWQDISSIRLFNYLIINHEDAYREYYKDITKVFDQIIIGENINVIDYVVQERPILKQKVGRKAAKFGKLKVLEWLYSKHIEELGPLKTLYKKAIRGGHVNIIRWLLCLKSTDIDILRTCSIIAAMEGQLEILKSLKSKSEPIKLIEMSILLTTAAWGGKLEILKWLREQRDNLGNIFPWSKYACVEAASRNHLEILKWLRDPELHKTKGGPCPWDEEVLYYAAENKNLEIFLWARYEADPPCPWREFAFMSYGGYQNARLVNWLFENNLLNFD